MLDPYISMYILPFVGILALGLITAFVARQRSSVMLNRRTRILVATGTAIGMVVAFSPVILGMIALVSISPSIQSLVWAQLDSQFRFVMPLVAGFIALALMSFVSTKNISPAGADLTRRSTFAFAPRGLLIALGITVTAIVALAITAGMASKPDDEGRYIQYWIESGAMRSGTLIYGWYYSLPATVALVALLGLITVSLWRISRPPLGIDAAAEGARRKLMSTFILLITLGAALLHLSDISASLRGTASLRMSASGFANGKMFQTWSTFAALGPAFNFAAAALGVAGVTIWAYVFWRSALGSKTKKED